jgi:16S rRNA (uracil1498-N3)-methyltransferase
MPRLFVQPEKITNRSIIIDGAEFIHLVHVLRCREGDSISVIDGTDREYQAQIHSIGQKHCTAIIREVYPGRVESPISVTLYQALIKIPRFEVIIEKVTELGVSRIVPVHCDRASAAGKSISAGRMKRWEHIIQSAACQSRRTKVPELSQPIMLEKSFKENRGSARLIFSPQTTYSHKAALASFGLVTDLDLFLGPEGGFTGEELALANSQGIVEVSLGKRILRAETAAIAALAQVFFELER